MLSQVANETISYCSRSLDDSVVRTGRRFGRRGLLKGVFCAIGLFSYADALATIGGGADFLGISSFLTNREIDTDSSERFRKAFVAQDAGFDEKVKQLAKSIASQGAASIDRLDMGALPSPDKACALMIIAAWYTGLVGNGADAEVVLFDAAFLYDVTRDAVVVPTYSVWGANYWTQAPPPAPMTGVAVPPPHFPVRYLLAIRRRLKLMWNFDVD